MKLQHVLFHHFESDIQDKTPHHKVTQLEEKIMTQILMTDPQTSNLPLSVIKAGLGFITIMFIIVGLSWYRTTPNKVPSFIPAFTSPAHATVLDIQQNLQTPFGYTVEHYQTCDSINFDLLSKNENGSYEYNPVTEKLKQDCKNNHNRLASSARYYVDPNQNSVRKETPIEEWQIVPPLPDKTGQLHESTIEPLLIQKNDTLYTFIASSVKNSKGNYEGVFVKPPKTGADKEYRKSSLNMGLLTPQAVLDTYSKAPANDIAIEERTDNDTVYLVLTHKNGTSPVHREDWFEKNSKLPYKSIEFDHDNKKISSETYYKNFDTDVNATAFDLQTPPKGYEFISGQISTVAVSPMLCETCIYGDRLTYHVTIDTYINSDGKVVSFPVQELERMLQLPFEFTIAEKTSDGSFKELSELNDTSNIFGIKLGKIYNSLYTVGSISQTTLQVTSTNKKTGEKISFEKQTHIPYMTAQLPSTDTLTFKYITDYGKGVREARYFHKKYPSILIAIQVNTDNVLCRGYRKPSTCTTDTDERGFTTATAHIANGSQSAPSWSRSDILYNDFFTTIQFKNTTTLPDETKLTIVEEVKTLLEKIDTSWAE